MSYGDDQYGAGAFGGAPFSDVEVEVEDTMGTLASFRTWISGRVKDAAGKLSDPTDFDAALVAALEEYSRDRPRIVVVQVTGADAFDYAVSGFGSAAIGSTASTQWVAGFSAIREVVYPYASSSRDLPTIENDLYGIVPLPAGETLRFASYTPAASEAFLVAYTRPHDVTLTIGTVPAGDRQAVANLAAAFANDTLANFYAQATDSTFDADVVDHRSRSSEYRAQSRMYRERYYAHVGRTARGDSANTRAASSFVDTDGAFSDLVRTDYFFHGRRRH